MSFFTKIDGAVALSYKAGIYQQLDVYTRNQLVFVKVGSGFARVAPQIGGRHPTTVPNLHIEEFDLPPRCGIITDKHKLVYRGH